MMGWVADIPCLNHGSPEDPEKKETTPKDMEIQLYQD